MLCNIDERVNKYRRKCFFQMIIFIVLCGLNAIDLTTDWLFYNDMNLLQKGLVFGSIGSSYLTALLVFSIVGVLTFLLELICGGRNIFQPDKASWIDYDIVSAFTVWIEEIPQITICVLIASCREEVVSVYRIAKASIVIIVCLGKFTILIFKCWLRSRNENKNNNKSIWCVVAMIGIILCFIGSILVLIFSYCDNADYIKSKKPIEFNQMNRDTIRYYYQVGIYLDGRELPINAQMSMNYDWIKLIDLTDIERHIYPAKKIKFSKTGSTKIQIQTILDRASKPPKLENAECYNKIDKWVVSNTSHCQNLFDTNETTADITIYFNFIQQSNYLIMGDVKYNTLNTTSPTGCSDCSGNHIELPLKYFKAKPMINDTFPKFYKLADLVPISEAWQTGYCKCKHAGSESPHWDNSIIVDFNCWS